MNIRAEGGSDIVGWRVLSWSLDLPRECGRETPLISSGSAPSFVCEAGSSGPEPLRSCSCAVLYESQLGRISQ